MKFDKTTITVGALCLVLVFAWTPFCKYMGWIKDELPPQVTTPQQSTEKTAPAAPAKATTQTAAKPVTPEVKLTVKKYDPVTLRNKDIAVTIDPNSGTVSSIKLENFNKSDKKTPVDFSDNILPGAFSIVDNSKWNLEGSNVKKSLPDKFILTRTMSQNGQKFELTQEWSVKDNYTTDYMVSLKNLSSSSLEFNDLQVMTGGLRPLLYLTGDGSRTERFDVEYYSDKFRSITADDDDEDFYLTVKSPVKWVGISNKYFACILKPSKPFGAGLKPFRSKTVIGPKKEYFTAAVAGVFKSFKLASGEAKSFDFKYYAGPKELESLNKFDSSVQQVMHLSMFAPMEWISRQLLKFLIWLKGICGSWGWSIIILTIIVRGIFWPITQKANKSMKNMQKLQPLIKELKEKYKDNQQMMNAKMMELYKIHKVNPLGGCLPILLQIPVFIALYSTIDSSVELRHTAFWWAHDLAQPDTVATIFGIAINPLVLAMTLLMVVQQRLTPAAADPMQQKMMLLMPVIMLFFMYNMPSGLTLYWTVSQIFSIIQLLINQKLNKDDDAGSAGTASPAKTS